MTSSPDAQENTVAEMTSKLDTVHNKTLELVAAIRKLIDEIFNKRTNERKQALEKMFKEFAKEDPNKNAINRQEMEQLFIACEQDVDEKLIDGLYSQGRPITFEDFYEIMDALENEKDTDEQCILAFS